MNKKQLIKSIAAASGMSSTQASLAIEATLSTFTSALEAGERITIQGFGTFSIVNRSARNGVNPSTGEIMKIPARKMIRFRTPIEVK